MNAMKKLRERKRQVRHTMKKNRKQDCQSSSAYRLYGLPHISEAALHPERRFYSYFVRYGIWCILMPVLAMALQRLSFSLTAFGLPESTETYDYRSYNNAFYGRFAPGVSPICLKLLVLSA